jgi:hypothetical protein
VGGDFFFVGFSWAFRFGGRVAVFFYAKTGDGLFNPVVVTDGAVNDPESLLLFKGLAALEPALEFMTLGTDQIKDDHG